MVKMGRQVTNLDCFTGIDHSNVSSEQGIEEWYLHLQNGRQVNTLVLPIISHGDHHFGHPTYMVNMVTIISHLYLLITAPHDQHVLS